MACEGRLKSLSRVAAGASPDAGLRGHLEECAACRARLEAAREALAAVDDALQDLSQVAPGEGFSRRVRRAAESQRVPLVWLPWVAAAAAAVVALGLLARLLLLPGPAGAPGRAGEEIGAVRRADAGADARAGAVGGEVRGEVRGEAGPPASAAAAPVRSREAPPRATGPSPAEVRVPAGQLEALVRYARLWQADDRAVARGAPETRLAALGPDPIRLDPLSVEPLSFDTEGESR